MKAQERNWGAKLVRIYRSYGMFFILAMELILFSLLTSAFFTTNNLLNVLRQISFIGISGVGLALVVIAGGIDISTGTMLALSGVLCAKLTTTIGLPLSLSICFTIVTSTVFGVLCGEVTARLRVPALISTLAFQTIYKGLAYFLTNAIPIYGISDSFKYLGQGYVFGVIPFPVVVMIVVFAIGYWFMTKTYIGRYIYAVGGNAECAHLSGINTTRVSVFCFAVCAFFTSIAGIMMTGRLGSGQPGTGSGFEMDVLTAVVLGGVSINGGKGNVLHVASGALIMGILSNGMMLIGLNEYIQWVIKGVVLVFAVTMGNLEIRTAKN
jgi:ribose transport system permease protein